MFRCIDVGVNASGELDSGGRNAGGLEGGKVTSALIDCAGKRISVASSNFSDGCPFSVKLLGHLVHEDAAHSVESV